MGEPSGRDGECLLGVGRGVLGALNPLSGPELWRRRGPGVTNRLIPGRRLERVLEIRRRREESA